MSVKTREDELDTRYSHDRAEHESRYIYGAVMSRAALKNALDKSEVEQARTAGRIVEVLGVNRFGQGTLSHDQQLLALSELSREDAAQRLQDDTHQYQLKTVEDSLARREAQAAADYRFGDDHGFDALIEDVTHLLPMPGPAALSRFYMDYLGAPFNMSLSQSDIPLMQYMPGPDRQ